MEYTVVNPIDINKNLLGILGRKMINGNKLTLAEDLMALSAYASMTSHYYGPGPAEMHVKTLDLPESVKGLMIEYAG
ncbi:hypothetical protein DDIC_10655 [Desulfovibrio desulfuricans]|uniref:Uncharacterized protein n=1 Tax=Desulfovibrio desulfuricans TaxID=876 RepID=A0A4P7UN71_DESDE|nr:hypothetical protein [Desulfovibrio desulfuricans]QCC86324.1 hypothetical protein DDIC_10655 [Desulfovibrio desulfuricans]